MNTNLGRTETALLTNKSGGALTQGAVVIIDTANASSFTTTTSSPYNSGRIGVILDPAGIANNAAGLVAFAGYVPVINLDGVAGIGDLVYTDTVAGQGHPHASPLVDGDFAQVLTASATPPALLFGLPIKTASVTSEMVQQVYTQTSAVQTGTATIPHDDTIPQNTEGTEFITLAITPANAANILNIDVTLNIAISAASTLIIAALFQDTTANALAVSAAHGIAGGNGHIVLRIQYSMVAGTTSATTFKIRAGGAGASTVTLNGHGAAREFGGAMYSGMRITEVLP